MTEREHHEVFRDGRVHVLAEKCSTCIFRPGNLMTLEPGRVKNMVDGCRNDETGAGNIPCHSTIWTEGVEPAICRGFYDAYRQDIPLLDLAASIGLIEEDPVPTRSWKQHPKPELLIEPEEGA